MATLAVQAVTRTGITPSYASCTSGGDKFLPDENTYLHVKNGSGGALTVTVATPGTVRGQAIADVAVSVGATSERMIGPFPHGDYADPSDGLAHVTYSGVTTLTIGAFKLAQP